MNKLKKLAGRLIENKLWASKIVYVVTMEEDADGIGLPKKWGDYSRLTWNVIIKKVSKNLVDNEKILNTDESIVISNSTYFVDGVETPLIPKVQDYIVRDLKKYKIVAIFPLGILDNDPTAYEIVMRLA